MRDRYVTLSGPGFALLALIIAVFGPRVLKWSVADVMMPWPLAYGLSFAVALVFGSWVLSARRMKTVRTIRSFRLMVIEWSSTAQCRTTGISG